MAPTLAWEPGGCRNRRFFVRGIFSSTDGGKIEICEFSGQIIQKVREIGKMELAGGFSHLQMVDGPYSIYR